jgi:hypothetical protein
MASPASGSAATQRVPAVPFMNRGVLELIQQASVRDDVHKRPTDVPPARVYGTRARYRVCPRFSSLVNDVVGGIGDATLDLAGHYLRAQYERRLIRRWVPHSLPPSFV